MTHRGHSQTTLGYVLPGLTVTIPPCSSGNVPALVTDFSHILNWSRHDDTCPLGIFCTLICGRLLSVRISYCNCLTTAYVTTCSRATGAEQRMRPRAKGDTRRAAIPWRVAGYGPPGGNHRDSISRITYFYSLPYQVKSDITGYSTVPVADGGLSGEESDGNLHDASNWCRPMTRHSRFAWPPAGAPDNPGEPPTRAGHR
jgi:hypothetical protein